MSIEQFAEGIAFLASRSPVFGGKPLSVTLIANPRAGGFTRPFVYSRHRRELKLLARRAAYLPDRGAPTTFRLHSTEYPKHAAEVTRALAEESRAEPEVERLVVTAGGDGTTLEALSTLMDLTEAERSRFVVLRLPMGTGNDGADSRELLPALELLLGPSRFDRQSALRVTPASAGKPGGKGPWWSFNIASLGADAFVSDMTNRLKLTFPGDSYKLWAELATVFYDALWPTRGYEVRAWDARGKEVKRFYGDILLLAMGVSGHRTYGSNKAILPDDDDVCLVRQMPLLRKLVVKGPLTTGRHRGHPEVDLFSAAKVEIGFRHRALVQMDGEVERLAAEDFPVVFERTEPAIRVIRKA